MKDVYLYTKNLEDRHRFAVDYLSESDSRVTNEMRATLINWLVEIHVTLSFQLRFILNVIPIELIVIDCHVIFDDSEMDSKLDFPCF